MTPLFIESWPKSGPTVLSSSTCIGAGNAPTLKTSAKSWATCASNLPLITASPEGIASLIRGADWTFPSKTIARRLPTLAAVISANFLAPAALNCRTTIGSLNWLWSKRTEALVKESPTKTACFSSKSGSFSSEVYFSSYPCGTVPATASLSLSASLETSLNSSIAVLPIRSMARCRSVTPGSCTTISSSPCF